MVHNVLSMEKLPYLTRDLPGVGGTLRQVPEDFRVDEVPAYSPTGEGEHVFVHIEKWEITTLDAVRLLAGALGVAARDVGYAGLKDRNAVARQWISVPPPCSPDSVLGIPFANLRVLEAVRHPHKLRTGHLRGNRFALTVRDVAAEESHAAQQTKEILELLAAAPGSPNWYGPQRFGRGNHNAMIGRDILLGHANGHAAKDRHKRRLFVSAFQSLLFNDSLRRRVERGDYRRVLPGDVLKKVDSGGMFCSSDVSAEQLRLQNGEIVPTGPVFGYRMKHPELGTVVYEQENELLRQHGLTLDVFRNVGKIGVGTRRPYAAQMKQARVVPVGRGAIEVCFALPPGSYATVVMREVMK